MIVQGNEFEFRQSQMDEIYPWNASQGNASQELTDSPISMERKWIELKNFSSPHGYFQGRKINLLSPMLPIFFIGNKNQTRKAIVLLAKSGAVICCFIASYPFIQPALKATDNFALNVALATGEVMSWSTLYSWSACNIINRIASSSLEDSVNFLKVRVLAYWVTLNTLAIFSELSGSYISFNYNDDSLFWAIFTPLFSSFFEIQSLDALVQKIAKTDNILTRYLYKNTNKTTVFRAKKNFTKLLEEGLQEILNNPKEHPIKNWLLPLVLDDKNEFKRDRLERTFKMALLKIIRHGLEVRMHYIESYSVYRKRGDKLVRIGGSLGALASSLVDGYLVYQGSRLILDNTIFNCFIAFLAFSPAVYLNIEINQNSCSQLLSSTIDVYSKTTEVCRKRKQPINYSAIKYHSLFCLGSLIATVIACFGIGSQTKVMEDEFGFDSAWSILLYLAVSVSGIIITRNSMSAFSDIIIKQIYLLKSSEEEKSLENFAERVKNLIKYFEAMPPEKFSEFFNEFDLDVLDIDKMANLLSIPDIQSFIKIIDDHFMEDQHQFDNSINPILQLEELSEQ
ncbi:hypothetical protein [Candidatus Protochlamydia sp. W-9]|uniref:hypothetical protein n=1 Tax=Candidatus Protochlamydia sp. W-9 TaxID=1785087 RepID=UPI00096A70B5|nr:hypothetical protein [Candidatus Protochlamydia sp. W-9]